MAGLRTTLDFATEFRHANCDLWPPHMRALFKGVRTISDWPRERPAPISDRPRGSRRVRDRPRPNAANNVTTDYLLESSLAQGARDARPRCAPAAQPSMSSGTRIGIVVVFGRHRNRVEGRECDETGEKPADMGLPGDRLLDSGSSDRNQPEEDIDAVPHRQKCQHARIAQA